jgi:hypothetical protein
MPSDSTFLTIVLLLALPLRVVLDLASANRTWPNFDIAYALLFIIVGVAVLVDNATSYLGYAMLGLSAWFLFSFILKRRRAQNVHE